MFENQHNISANYIRKIFKRSSEQFTMNKNDQQGCRHARLQKKKRLIESLAFKPWKRYFS